MYVCTEQCLDDTYRLVCSSSGGGGGGGRGAIMRCRTSIFIWEARLADKALHMYRGKGNVGLATAVEYS